MHSYLEFEKSLAEIEGKAHELQQMAKDSSLDVEEEASRLQAKAEKKLEELYKNLTPWHKCMVARHPGRPRAQAFIDGLLTDYMPLCGDRAFAEDKAIIGGLARLNNHPVMVLAQEKGHDTKTRLEHNFGMMRPEGYRKAIRLMRLADKFKVPLICLVDTPGAYPGKGAEARGQAEAIARTIETSLEIRVPIISLIIGEGGSGGAVALATANEIAIMEHAIYSVISPEGCASILWKSADKAREAATALQLTAQDLLEHKVVDRVVAEPSGGAHRFPQRAISAAYGALCEMLTKLNKKSPKKLREERREKFLQIGSI